MNRKGNSFVFLLSMLAVASGSAIFSNLNKNDLDKKIFKYRAVRSNIRELRQAIHMQFSQDCTAVLANEAIGGSVTGNDLVFPINLPYIDSSTIAVGDHIIGAEIANITTELNDARPDPDDDGEGPLQLGFGVLHIDFKINDTIVIGDSNVRESVFFTYVPTASQLVVNECIVGGDFTENCWFAGLPADCTRTQWMALIASRVCHYVAEVEDSYASCENAAGTDKAACCNPLSGETDPLISEIWLNAFGTPI